MTDRLHIEVRNITKQFGAFTALNDVNLQVKGGELMALLGPSGSGKTTLLRILAGLETPDQGLVLYDDKDVTGSKPKDRRVGLVFQHYALFKHMSVFENVAFGLRVRPKQFRPSESEIREKVMTLLGLVQLSGMEHRFPTQLSGGQRQRVALARTLAVEPRLLLLDEPFGALDARVRKDLRRWLRKFHDEMKITTIFVTHDQEEALEIADTVVVMNHARIEQTGKPEAVYNHPANPFVYQFLGNVNLFHGRIDQGQVRIGADVFQIAHVEEGQQESEAIAYVRPHDIEIHTVKPSGRASLPATVTGINGAGAVARIFLYRQDNNSSVEVELNHQRYLHLDLKLGQEVFLSFHKAKVFSEDYSI
ncbi:MAG: sulfate ABC transporter ATP-binding protein [Verrucomicrobiae bacterium]|nr:sulfate ABC transporter ATP-binding protein [Verrucomicrobiae bacterium]